MNELAHGSSNDGHVVFAFGLESQAQGAHQRVVGHRGQRREVEQLAQETVALLAKAGLAAHRRARGVPAWSESDKGGALTGASKARALELPHEPGPGPRADTGVGSERHRLL